MSEGGDRAIDGGFGFRVLNRMRRIVPLAPETQH